MRPETGPRLATQGTKDWRVFPWDVNVHTPGDPRLISSALTLWLIAKTE